MIKNQIIDIKCDLLEDDNVHSLEKTAESKPMEDKTEITGNAFSLIKVSNKQQFSVDRAGSSTENDEMGWSSGDEDENQPTGLNREQLRQEFISIMEERFLEGTSI